MKKQFTLLAIGLLVISQNTVAQQMQKEVESTIESFIKCSEEKDLDKAMKYWLNSEDFVYIADGQELGIQQLRKLTEDFFANVEKQEIIEHSITVKSLGEYKACCIWRGTERIKMKEQEPIESSWVSTLIMENKKGGWVIIHGHTSHF